MHSNSLNLDSRFKYISSKNISLNKESKNLISFSKLKKKITSSFKCYFNHHQFFKHKRWSTWLPCVPKHTRYKWECSIWILSIEVNDQLMIINLQCYFPISSHYPASLLKTFGIPLSSSGFWKADSFLPLFFPHPKQCQTPGRNSITSMCWTKVKFDYPGDIPQYQNQNV